MGRWSKAWIGVDLDGTLAEYETGSASKHQIGKPVPAMVQRVREWLARGIKVKIMTARVNKIDGWDHEAARKAIQAWTKKLFGVRLEVTNEKDFLMIELWDDRAVRVEEGTGRKLSPSLDLDGIEAFLTRHRG